MTTLLVIGFDTKHGARQMLTSLLKLAEKHKEINVADACYAIRTDDGGLEINQEMQDSVRAFAKRAGWGMLAGGIAGLLTLNPMGAVAGAGIGATLGSIQGYLSDHGIDNDFIRKTSSRLEDSSSALFVLLEGGLSDLILSQIVRYNGWIMETSLSGPKEARLREILEGASERHHQFARAS